MKNFRLHLLTATAILGSVFFIVPNLSVDQSDYDFVIKTFKSSSIEEKEYRKKFRKRIKRTLILNMKDNSRWEFSEQYDKYWNTLANKNNVGKKYKIYLTNAGVKNSNPPSVEIAGNVVYGFGESQKIKYLFLLITFLLFITSAYFFFTDVDHSKK